MCKMMERQNKIEFLASFKAVENFSLCSIHGVYLTKICKGGL